MSVLILFFNNCKRGSEAGMELQGLASATLDPLAALPTGPTGATGTICEQEIKNLYARGWQSFLYTNCASCHANGPGKGRFANPEVNLAYSEFDLIGYPKVSSNAINPGHNSPYSGLQHIQKVADLKLEWQKGLQDYALCSNTPVYVPQQTQIEKISLKSTEQNIGLAQDGDSKVLTWTISSELTRIKGTTPAPNIPGGKFSITVTRLKNSGGYTYYTFSSPTVFGNTVDVHLEGLFINLNGILLNYASTFSYLVKDIRMGAVTGITGIISTGSLVAPKVVATSDQLSLSFIDIKQVSLPAEAAPLTINVDGAKAIIVAKNTSFLDVSITLSGPAVEPIVVTLSENSDFCGTPSTLTNSNTLFKPVSDTCLVDIKEAVCPAGVCPAANTTDFGLITDFGLARSEVGSTFSRFDWDYRFPIKTVTFSSGQSNKKLRIYFSKDIRLENNRVFIVDIVSVLGSVKIGANKSQNFIITKYNNPVPNGLSLTFSRLMNPISGVLGTNCTKCHNSNDFAGKYNMSDHQLMLDNSVIIPYDVTSKMYLRTHPNAEYFGKPMPVDGFLPDTLVRPIERWILNGALNN